MGAVTAQADASSSPDTPHLAAIGKALGRLKAQFEEAYLDDHKLVVDDGKYDQSYLNNASAEQLRQLELRPDESQRQLKSKRKARDDDSDKPWSARFQQRQKRARKHREMADAFELTGDPELDMMVDPSEFGRILDLVHAKRHLDNAYKSFLQAFDAGTPLAQRHKLLEMLEHLGDLDNAIGYSKTDPNIEESIKKGPVVEYKMDGAVIAKALSEISTVLNDHLGIKNQLANGLRDDPLLGQFLR